MLPQLKAMPMVYCRREMVEAAGVEPASEKVLREKPTCVSGLQISAAVALLAKSPAAKPD